MTDALLGLLVTLVCVVVPLWLAWFLVIRGVAPRRAGKKRRHSP